MTPQSLTTIPRPATNRVRLRAAIALALPLTLTATPSRAQISMSLSPVRVEHAVGPGETWTDIVTVDNVASTPLRARVTVADWFLERDGTPVFVKRGSHADLSMSDWIEVNPTEFVVPPGGSQVVRYTLSVPVSARPASYRTAVLVESLPDFSTASGANTAYLTGRIGVILYNRIGSGRPVAEVVGQEVFNEPGVPGAVAIRLTIRNAGLVHFRFSGQTAIHTAEGRLQHMVPIPDGVVLPRSERTVVLRVDHPTMTAPYRVVSRVDTGQDELLVVETHVGVAAANDGAP